MITTFQWIQIIGFLLVQTIGIVWGVSKMLAAQDKDHQAQREEDRKEHDLKHQQIWGGVNRLEAFTRDEISIVREAHNQDVRALEGKIAERPDRQSLEKALEQIEQRLGTRIETMTEQMGQLIQLVRDVARPVGK